MRRQGCSALDWEGTCVEIGSGTLICQAFAFNQVFPCIGLQNFPMRFAAGVRRLRFLYGAKLGMYDVIRAPEEPPMRYTVILQRESDGGYVVSVPALPGCVSQGDSREEALKNIEEAIELYLEDVKAAGEPIPVEDGREYVEVTAGSK